MTNVGYRLLRCTARVEPAGTPWVRLRPEHNGRPFSTIDQTDLPIELDLPETIDRPFDVADRDREQWRDTSAIAVRIERPAEQVVVPESAAGASVSGFRSWDNI